MEAVSGEKGTRAHVIFVSLRVSVFFASSRSLSSLRSSRHAIMNPQCLSGRFNLDFSDGSLS
jgi:hypothetical protein